MVTYHGHGQYLLHCSFHHFIVIISAMMTPFTIAMEVIEPCGNFSGVNESLTTRIESHLLDGEIDYSTTARMGCGRIEKSFINEYKEDLEKSRHCGPVRQFPPDDKKIVTLHIAPPSG